MWGEGMASQATLRCGVVLGLLVLVPQFAWAQSGTRRQPAPASQPFRYTPEEQEICLPEVERLCDIMQQPAVILACLHSHWDDVSEECRTVIERRGDGPK